MNFKTYDLLPEEAASIRRAVFVEEQGFAEEFDEKDETAKHIVLYDDEDRPIATCRYFWDREKGAYVVGRIAVVKECRLLHCGAALLHEAERQILEEASRTGNSAKAMVAAQVRAKGFYEKQGFTAEGEEFLEEYCPHIWMRKIF